MAIGWARKDAEYFPWWDYGLLWTKFCLIHPIERIRLFPPEPTKCRRGLNRFGASFNCVAFRCIQRLTWPTRMARHPQEQNPRTNHTKPPLAHVTFFARLQPGKNGLGGRFRYWPCGFLRTLITPSKPIDPDSPVRVSIGCMAGFLVPLHSLLTSVSDPKQKAFKY